MLLLSYFNSIKVRLELIIKVLIYALSLIFQFHKGTIRTKLQNQIQELNANFNSIKVRLEPTSVLVLLNQIHQFQFHKGTIRTQNGRRARSWYRRFQFHKGTIRTFHVLFFFNSDKTYFNSIKVRLELIKVLIYGSSVKCIDRKKIFILW